MPWCDTCSKFWNPPELGGARQCPVCGAVVTSPAGAVAAPQGMSARVAAPPATPDRPPALAGAGTACGPLSDPGPSERGREGLGPAERGPEGLGTSPTAPAGEGAADQGARSAEVGDTGAVAAAGTGPATRPAAANPKGAPWHFKLLVAGVTVYMIYRIYWFIEWLPKHI